MGSTLKTLLIASALILPISAYAGHEHAEKSQHEHAQPSEQNGAMGTGVIHSISQINRKVNITHDPIPALKWPEMTMDLDVADAVDLKAVKPGDEIRFHIVLGDDKVYRITKMMKKDHDQSDAKQCMEGEDCPMHEGMKHPGKDGHMEKMHEHMEDMHGDHEHGEKNDGHNEHQH
ncbi:MAG: copper-binding protein [Rickettsiales bacterium]|nr:copper-binding protein [Rickettsiales bacterium]